jgi:hypothetical protein
MENAEKVVDICRNYKRLCEIDISYGRQVVDGCSVLGVMSLVGHTVTLTPLTDDLITKTMIRDALERMS